VEVYNEGEGERKDKGKRCKGEAESEQVKELNDEGCTRYLGGKGESTSSVQFTDGQSEDRPVYSGGFIYISTVCTYVALLTSQQIDKWSVRMVRAQMTS
jgi:hypothetical protein